MARTHQGELMPVGGSISHDDHTLKIEKRLQSGLTGEVYEGFLEKEDQTRIHVAVKVMKTLDFPAARQLFLQESETLAFLMHLEEEANREQGLSLKVAPVYYGRGEYEGTPYLVMEFIEGDQIFKILQRTEGGRFSEAKALTIAWHLFRTLDVLHRLLKKTYIDLKSENLWWIESGELAHMGQLKLTDFGTLEDIRPDDKQKRGVARDLLRAASYFCKLVTGYMPDFLLDELRSFDVLKKNLADASTSSGTRRELQRMLHPDIIQRPADASLVAANLRALVDFWTLDVQKVLDITRKTLERAQIAYDVAMEKGEAFSSKWIDAAYRARAAIDILAIRDPNLDLSHEKGWLEQILKLSNHLERGKNLLRGHSYKLAKEVFHEGMIWEEDAASLRRWAYLADFGEIIVSDNSKSIRDRSFSLLDQLFLNGRWQESLTELNGIGKDLTIYLKGKSLPKGFFYLDFEAHLFNEISQADEALVRNDFATAEKHYVAALSYFEKLPDEYQKNIRENDLGDIRQNILSVREKLDASRRQAEVDAQFDAAIEFFRKQGFDEDGSTLDIRRSAEETYRRGYALKHHVERLHEVIQAALEAGKYDEAFHIAQIPLLGAEIREPLESDLLVTAGLYGALQSLKVSDNFQFEKYLLTLLSFAGSDQFIRNRIEDVLARAKVVAEKKRDADLYRALALINGKMGNSIANEQLAHAEAIKTEQSAERHARVDALLAEANSLNVLSLAEFNAAVDSPTLAYSQPDLLRILGDTRTRYEYIRQILDAVHALSKVDGYLLDQVEQFRQDLFARISRLPDRQADDYSETLSVLNRWWLKIEPLLQWRTRSLELFKDSDASRAIHRQLYGEVMDFLVACYSLMQDSVPTGRLAEKLQEDALAGNQPLPVENRAAVHVLIANAHKALDSLGIDAWRSIQREGTAMLQKEEAFLGNARQAFEQGDLAQAQALLEQSKIFASDSHEWKALRIQAQQVALWNKWQRDHAEMLASLDYDADALKTIRTYKSCKLPIPYWRSSSAEAYLNGLDKRLYEQVTQKITDYNNPENTLIETLNHWLNVSWTSRFPSVSDATWNARVWLDGVYLLLIERKVDGLANAVRNAALPASVEDALVDINIETWRSVVASREWERKDAQMRVQKRNKQIIILASIAVILCVLFGSGLFLSRNFIYQFLSGTYTPTPSVTPTFTPTFTPTASVTPTGTPTLTPIPPSVYLVTDLNVIRPSLPAAAEFAWMIPPENARTEPDLGDQTTWTRQVSAEVDTRGEIFYTTQKQVNVYWETDQPLLGGWYAIFILDTKSKSGGMGPLTFQVSSNETPLNPVRGQSTAIFKSSMEKQAADEWIPLGVYEITAGQKMAITVYTQPLQGDAVFALSKLLIVKMTEPQRALYEALPSGRALFALSDDSTAVVLDTAAKVPLSADYQGTAVVDLNSWNGVFRSLPLDSLKGVSNKVSVQWTFPGLLPAGKYQILVYIPSTGSTAQGEFIMTLNGKPLEKQPLPVINQKDHGGEWWSVDIWNLPEQGAVTVQFLVDPSVNPGGLLGIDSIALVRVE